MTPPSDSGAPVDGDGPHAPVLADVAERAGVSQQTVSRVVNGSPAVARHTRQRVQQAIEEIGYRPNAAARALVTRRSRRIGVVAASSALHGAAMTLLGVQEAAREAGYSVAVVMVGDLQPASVEQALRELRDQSVDGAVAIVPEEVSQAAVAAAEATFPCVLAPGSGGAGVADASGSEVSAAREVTAHLLRLGHETVHHLAGPADWAESRSRATGWRTALVEAGRRVPPPVRGDWTASSGYLGGERLLAAGATAIFAANDHMAIGAIRAVVESDLQVPGDVSVVGFDDLPEAAYLNPPLTTVYQDFADIGRRCVRVLLSRLTDRLADSVVDLSGLSPSLVVRASTGPPERGGRRPRPAVPTAGEMPPQARTLPSS